MIAYIAAFALIVLGMAVAVARDNFIKKVMGLTISVNGIHLLLISIGYKTGGIAPIMTSGMNFFSFSGSAVDPLPQAMVLTSIVIDLSMTALMLGIVIMLYSKTRTLRSSKTRRLKG